MRVINMALKDLLLLWRDKFGMFWVTVFPLAYAALFGSIFSGGGSDGPNAIRIAVVDQDSTTQSANFITEMDSSDALDITMLNDSTARDRVRRGKLTGMVVIEDGFHRFNPFYSGGGMPIRIGIDPSRKAEAGYLKGILTRLMFKSFQSRMSDPDRMISEFRQTSAQLDSMTSIDSTERNALKGVFGSLETLYSLPGGSSLGQEPFRMGEIEAESVERERTGTYPRSSYDVSFPQAIIWGLIGCAAAFAISLVQERTTGTLLRLKLAPVSRVHILAGKALACFMACVFAMVMLLLIGKIVFGVNTSHTVRLAAAVLASSFCFVGVMMLISVLGKTERSVAGAGWAILMVFAMFGGGMVPAMFLPSWMQPLSQVTPVRWAIYSLEGAVWRDFSWNEMMTPLAILIGIGLLFFSVGAFVFSKTES